MPGTSESQPPTSDQLRMPDLTPGKLSYAAELVRGDVKAHLHFHGQPREIYSMFATFDKVSSFGTIGRRQEERAKALLVELLQLFHEALVAHGWQLVTREELATLSLSACEERWRHVGLMTSKMEQQMTALAAKIWHGPYQRQGTDKVAPSDLFPQLAYTLPYGNWHPVGHHLEIAVRTSDSTIHVRRVQIAIATHPERGTDQESQTLSVLDGAYHRTIKTTLRKFRCAWCEQIVEQQCWPGRRPYYCKPACAQAAEREHARARAQRLRERRKAAAEI